MTQTRSRWLTLPILALMVKTGLAQETTQPSAATKRTVAGYYEAKAPKKGVCRFYSLAEFGDEGSLGKWIAETLPQVIEPTTWVCAHPEENVYHVKYFAPKKLLVVYHTAETQARVEGFLNEMKKAMVPTKEKTAATVAVPGVMQAKFQTPDIVESVAPARVPQVSYPVPAQVAQPKHLFHFIIRYEGAGIIDDSVIKFIKAQQTKATKESKEPTPSPGSCLGAVIGAVAGSSCDPLVSEKPIPFGAPASASTPTLVVPQKMKPIVE